MSDTQDTLREALAYQYQARRVAEVLRASRLAAEAQAPLADLLDALSTQGVTDKSYFDLVTDWHNTFNVLVQTTPQVPSEDVRQLRLSLIREEVRELVAALEADDMVEIADGCADAIVVICGTASSYGIPLNEIFVEVHSSNMSKLGEDGKPIYREDGKVLKGPNFFKPRIRAILEKAGWHE